MHMRMSLFSIVIWHVQMAPELFWSFSISNLQTESFTPFNGVSLQPTTAHNWMHEKDIGQIEKLFSLKTFSPNYNYVYDVHGVHGMLGRDNDGAWLLFCMIFDLGMAFIAAYETDVIENVYVERKSNMQMPFCWVGFKWVICSVGNTVAPMIELFGGRIEHI